MRFSITITNNYYTQVQKCNVWALLGEKFSIIAYCFRYHDERQQQQQKQLILIREREERERSQRI